MGPGRVPMAREGPVGKFGGEAGPHRRLRECTATPAGARLLALVRLRPRPVQPAGGAAPRRTPCSAWRPCARPPSHVGRAARQGPRSPPRRPPAPPSWQPPHATFSRSYTRTQPALAACPAQPGRGVASAKQRHDRQPRARHRGRRRPRPRPQRAWPPLRSATAQPRPAAPRAPGGARPERAQRRAAGEPGPKADAACARMAPSSGTSAGQSATKTSPPPCPPSRTSVGRLDRRRDTRRASYTTGQMSMDSLLLARAMPPRTQSAAARSGRA